MRKKIIISISILVVLIVSFLVYYLNFLNKTEEVQLSSVYSLIPTDAALIIESKDISSLKQKLNTNSKIWELLINISEVNFINKSISFIDSVLRNNIYLKSQLQKKNIIVSLHHFGRNDFSDLYTIQLNISSDDLEKFFKSIYNRNINIEQRNYNNNVIYIVKSNDSNFYSEFCVTYIKGWLFISPSMLLIESVIRQANASFSLLDNKYFKKIAKTSGKNVDINIYINHKLFQKIYFKWLSNDLSKKISEKRYFAEWTAVDVHVSNNMFLINGFTDQGDSLANYLKIFNSQDPSNVNITEILPKETYMFIFYSISNFSKWYEDYKKFLEIYGTLDVHLNDIKQVKQKTNTDFIDLFNKLIYKECAFVLSQNTEKTDTSFADNMYFVLRTSDRSYSKELLDSFLNKYARKCNLKIENLISNIKLDAEYSLDVYNFPVSNMPQLLFGSIYDNLKTKYYIFVDNYIVFSNSKEALKRFYYAFTLKNTLYNDKVYKSYKDIIDQESNLLIYFDITRSQLFLKSVFGKKLMNIINKNYDIISQLDGMCFQLTKSNDMFYTSIIIKYSPETKENTHTVWESKLDTIMLKKPTFVINHNTQEKEIFIQDAANNIYLINSTGRILWKNSLPEQIKSEVFQIDILKNKKLQYLFNTRNYIYVVDRNGDNVYPFPIKLKSPATNGINIADFGKNDLRLMIACEDKNVYLYTLQGNLDKMWKFAGTNHKVYQPIQYVNYEQKNYVFFADSLNIYILNKFGKEQIKLKEHFPINRNALLYFEPKNKETEARFVINDIFGNVKFIDLNGNVKTLRLEEKSSEHYFLYNDMDGDGLSEFIFVDKNYLTIYKRNKKVMLNYKLPSPPTYKPIYYEFPMAMHKIGLVCGNKLLLIDREGNMPKGFPLNGISPFSISHLEKPIRKYYLITGNNNGYLINYEVFK
jgi:hypothetical protein